MKGVHVHRAGPTMTPVSALDESAAIRRLTDRFAFGARSAETSFAAAAAAVLATAAPAPGLSVPDLGPQPDLTIGTQGSAARQQLAAQEATLTDWWLDRMVTTPSPLAERMTWLWHGHFATSGQKVRSAVFMQRQNDTLRQFGTGAFPALARAIMIDPAMLIWLDAQQNRVGTANENLARESMELFLLGIGHYTETDVREAARALTGWTVNRTTGAVALAPKRHDNGSKTILGQTADFDVNSFVDLVLAQPNSPRFVTGRLWYRLVSSTPPSAAVLDRLVAAYGPTGDIAATLRAITAEPAFVDSANVQVKAPVDWAVGLMRALGVRPGGKQLSTGLRAMGQVPFLPPNVGGWPADGAWLTTAAALARLKLAALIVKQANLSAVRGSSAAARAESVRQLLNVDTWTPRTLAALAKVAGDPRAEVAIAACAPEYVVSQ